MEGFWNILPLMKIKKWCIFVHLCLKIDFSESKIWPCQQIIKESISSFIWSFYTKIIIFVRLRNTLTSFQCINKLLFSMAEQWLFLDIAYGKTTEKFLVRPIVERHWSLKRTRMGWNIHRLKGSYKDVISAIYDFFQTNGIQPPMEEECGSQR